jgi:hypothetical protein
MWQKLKSKTKTAPVTPEKHLTEVEVACHCSNVSYESETTIAKQIGVDGGALNGWLAGEVKPTPQSLLKVRDFLEHQVETRGGIAPVGYVPIRGNNPNGRRGKRVG